MNEINKLFNDLCASLVYHRPEDVRAHLREQLELSKQKQLTLFNSEEIDIVFDLHDLERRGKLTKEDAVKAFCQMTSSEKQVNKARELLKELNDRADFRQVATTVFDL